LTWANSPLVSLVLYFRKRLAIKDLECFDVVLFVFLMVPYHHIRLCVGEKKLELSCTVFPFFMGVREKKLGELD
jgi:hypothetical protein